MELVANLLLFLISWHLTTSTPFNIETSLKPQQLFEDIIILSLSVCIFYFLYYLTFWGVFWNSTFPPFRVSGIYLLNWKYYVTIHNRSNRLFQNVHTRPAELVQTKSRAQMCMSILVRDLNDL